MRKYPRFNLYLDEQDKTMLYKIASEHQQATGRPVSPSKIVKQWIQDEYARLFGEDTADAAPDVDALAV